MKNVTAYFKRRKILFEKLIPFGFVMDNENYIYKEIIADGQFEMRVEIFPDRTIFTKVTDLSTQYEYILHLVGTQGEFIGKVREDYENVLEKINGACFETNVFKSNMAQKIILYVRNTYGDELEFLWKKFPNNAVFRRKDSSKWYAALLTVQKSKLDIKGQDTIEILDLRILPEELDSLIDNKNYFPGYHMNKEHWFTICLDSSVSFEEITRRIDTSYQLAKK